MVVQNQKYPTQNKEATRKETRWQHLQCCHNNITTVNNHTKIKQKKNPKTYQK